ncbi:MAG: hypothetical protein IKI45_11325 [Oscillospiraceae bacterium]|nr:hypothetical protein [Oscillospiraceae bacterium]
MICNGSKKALYEVIKENLVNGELPDSFSLPKDENTDQNKIKWADGALDGVGIFHMSQPTITDEQIQMIGEAFSVVSDHQEAAAKMGQFFRNIPPVRGIDAIQRYIIDHENTLDPETVYQFASYCVCVWFREESGEWKP